MAGQPTPRPCFSSGLGITWTVHKCISASGERTERVSKHFAIKASGFRYVLTVNMIDHLMSHAAVVLQNIVLLGARGDRNLLSNREELGQVLIRNVVKLGAVVLGNHKSMTLRDGANIKKCVRLF